MPEVEPSKDKNSSDKKTQSISPEEKATPQNKSKEDSAKAAPQKSVWDLPDGEFSEVFDSEGHRNRINYY